MYTFCMPLQTSKFSDKNETGAARSRALASPIKALFVKIYSQAPQNIPRKVLRQH